MNTIEGTGRAAGFRFALVVSKYNDFVTDRLQAGAMATLAAGAAASDDITIVRVPGAFEIPLAAQHAAESGRFDAIICLGAVIRGATPHFEYVSAEVSKGIAHVSLDSGVPVAFGVLTTDTIEQAVERAGTKAGNKGFDAAMTAIETANLFKGMK